MNYDAETIAALTVFRERFGMPQAFILGGAWHGGWRVQVDLLWFPIAPAPLLAIAAATAQMERWIAADAKYRKCVVQEIPALDEDGNCDKECPFYGYCKWAEWEAEEVIIGGVPDTNGWCYPNDPACPRHPQTGKEG